MSQSEVKKRVHLLKAYEKDFQFNEKEELTKTLKAYVNRCISSCENEKLIYCAEISKKINN